MSDRIPLRVRPMLATPRTKAFINRASALAKAFEEISIALRYRADGLEKLKEHNAQRLTTGEWAKQSRPARGANAAMALTLAPARLLSAASIFLGGS